MVGQRIKRKEARRRGVAHSAVLGLVVALLVVAPAAASVPRATGDNAVITVKVGGVRQGDGQIEPLSGVTLQLLTYDGDSSPGAPVNAPWSTCTSDARGDCSFVVPETGAAAGGSPAGANRDRRFWVTQVAAPVGWFTNPTIRTGTSTAAESTAQPYRFLTGEQLRAGSTYHSGTSFMSTVGGSTAQQRLSSGGTWQQSHDNPAAPSSCGLDVALVLDLSGSVGGQIGELRNAGNAFVDALRGTPSRMSVFSFSYGSPAQNAKQNHPDLQPVSDTAGGNIVKGWIADGTPAGGTNWDRGLQAATDANRLRDRPDDRYDMAIVLTDGNPTNWGGTGTTAGTVEGNGSNNRIIEVEKAVFSANALKAQGTRVIAFGVGAGVTDPTTALNLSAISGKTKFTSGSNPIDADYFQEPSFADAAAALRSIALATCRPSISVLKMIVPPGNTGEDVSGAQRAPEGWTFNASSPTVPVVPPSRTTTDDGTGAVNFTLDFAGGAASAGVTITEAQHDDHVLVRQGGSNAVCTDLDTNTRIPVTNVGGPTDPNPGFTVPVTGPPNEQAISCTVYDRPPAPPPDTQPADLTVFKGWVVRVGDTRQFYREGTQPGFLQAQLSVTSPVDDTQNDLGWGVTAPGYSEGDTPEIDETVAVDRPRCELVARRVTRANGTRVNEELPFRPTLKAGSNRFLVVNVVECSTRITLRKIVLDRGTGTDAVPGDWTLTAEGRTRVSGPANSAAVTKQRIRLGRYRLSESGGPPGFETSGWSCIGADKIRRARISADIGQDIVCIVVNVAQPQPEPQPEPGPEPAPPPPEVLGDQGFLRTRTSQRRVQPGEPFSDRIRIEGLIGDEGATAVARLYGPFSSRAAAVCRPKSLAREEAFPVSDGRNRSPNVRVSTPGVYTWQVALGADAATASIAHRCGLAAETTVVAKPTYAAPAVVGGFSGTLPGFDREFPTTTVEIPDIGMRAAIQATGIVGGEMVLPGQVGDVGWLRRSAGFSDMIGTAVIAGHVSDRHDRPGAMVNLRRARSGQQITVSQAGERHRYEVVEKTILDRRSRLPDRYFATTGQHRVVLISCTDRVVTAGGRFHYTKFIVVVAKPVRRNR